MRKILIAALAASALVPSMASAQSMREVRNDQREVRKDRQDARAYERQGNYKKAAAARQEAREDQRETREDWREYRRTHSQVFRRGAYTAPRGYAYRSVRAGVNLNPAFYGNRYWVNDYGTYRLPAPGYNHRWVRYGNDVALVDIRSGRVLRVYTGFFY